MKAGFISQIDERYAKAVLPLAFYKDCQILRREEEDGKWSTYTINDKRIIKIKASDTKGKRVRFWRFVFDLVEQSYLNTKDKTTKAYLLLICDDMICSLSWHEAKQLMPESRKEKSLQLRVVRRRQDDHYTYTVNGSESSPLKPGKMKPFTPSGLDNLWKELCA